MGGSKQVFFMFVKLVFKSDKFKFIRCQGRLLGIDPKAPITTDIIMDFFFHKNSISIWYFVIFPSYFLSILALPGIATLKDFLLFNNCYIRHTMNKMPICLDFKVSKDLNLPLFQTLLNLIVPVVFTTFRSKPLATFPMDNSGNACIQFVKFCCSRWANGQLFHPLYSKVDICNCLLHIDFSPSYN